MIDRGKALDHYQGKARKICATFHSYMNLTRAFFAGVLDGDWNGPDEDKDERFVPRPITVCIYAKAV